MRNSTVEKSIVIFGAGKIGRSFIGQLFSRAGYKVVFIDINYKIIDEINRRKKYEVVIKSDNRDEVLEVTNVCGIYADDTDAVMTAITDCNLMATCVGKNAFNKILPIVAKGIEKRFRLHPDSPVDIILAENIRDAQKIMKTRLAELLVNNFPVNLYIGFIETSIGKMVPIMPKAVENKDPLLVYAEPYNTLIVDKNGFKNFIPDIEGLSPKENIKAWVDRKAFIHNLGHATVAYYGAFRHPDAIYIYEVLSDPVVYRFTKEVMLQSASILQAIYPNDYSINSLKDHIDDLLTRFRNKALKDTIYRVGQDRIRKLGPEDRFVGIIQLAINIGKKYDKILKAMTYAFCFKTTDENGKRCTQDILFDSYEKNGLKFILREVCGFEAVKHKKLILEFMHNYSC
jgi:mannitol-1-phosphate 5-dehydrogenase